MADEVQQAEGQQAEEPTEKQQEVADQFAQADQQADPEPPSVEEIASRMGWVPKEKFRDDESKWKPADQFILDGHEIQNARGRELKEIRATLDNVAKTSGAIMAERLQQQHEALAAKYAAAVEKGDPDEAFKLGRQIDQVIEQRNGVSAPRAPDQATVEWVEKNTWMKTDPYAAKRAIAICDEYARAGLPPADQVAKTEAVMRREFPHLFEQAKAPPGVNEPTSRMVPAQKRGKTASDLPKAARDIARDLVERGLIKDEESYARNYFAQVERMQ